MAVSLEALMAFMRKSAAATAPTMSPGNQAMAAAAQMAAPPGAPAMPKPIDPPVPAVDPNATQEMQAQQLAADKDKEIAKLREDLQKANLETERAEMRADMQQQQQQLMDSLRKEKEALERREVELAAQEKVHAANMKATTVHEKAQVTKSEAEARANIAAQEAESAKRTAFSNAQAFVKMTGDARKEADNYMNQQKSLHERQLEEERSRTPFMPVALQKQLDGAMAAAKNVAKLRKRLIKEAAGGDNFPAFIPPTPKPAPAPSAAPPTPKPQSLPLPPVTKAPTQPTPAPAPAPVAPAQASAPNKGSGTMVDSYGNPYTAAAARAEANSRRIAEEAQYRRAQELKWSHIHDKLILGNDAVSNQQGIAYMKGQLDIAKKEDPNGFDANAWQEAIDEAEKRQAAYLNRLNNEADNGNEDAKDELYRLKDFQNKRETSSLRTTANLVWNWNTFTGLSAGVSNRIRTIIGASKQKPSTGSTAGGAPNQGRTRIGDALFGDTMLSEEDEARIAGRNYMTPEQWHQQQERDKPWYETWITDPLGYVGGAVNEYDRAQQLAANRGTSLNWFSNKYEGANGNSLKEALQQRNLSQTMLGHGGNIALNAALTGASAVSDVMMLTGVGAVPSAFIRGAGGLGVAVNAARAAGVQGGKSMLSRAAQGYRVGSHLAGKAVAKTPLKWNPNLASYGVPVAAADIGLGIARPEAAIPYADPTRTANEDDMYMSQMYLNAPYNNGNLAPGGYIKAANVTGNTRIGGDAFNTDYAYYMTQPRNTSLKQELLSCAPSLLEYVGGDSWFGKGMKFISPIVSNVVDRVVNPFPKKKVLTPSNTYGWNSDAAVMKAMTQIDNPLYNQQINRGGQGTLQAMRANMVANPQSGYYQDAPAYNSTGF